MAVRPSSPPLPPTPYCFTFRPRLIYRRCQQARVQVEADGSYLTALFGAENIARAPDFQVFEGDAEARAQFRRLLDCREALASRFRYFAARMIQEVRVGAVGSPTHAPA